MSSRALHERKPGWIKAPIPNQEAMGEMRRLLGGLGLNTICEEASCPNIGTCWGSRTATFLILGKVCTRRCGFCDVETGRPEPVDFAEPFHVARAVKELGLRHVVITSPDRDDLEDKGAGQFAAVTRAIQRMCPLTTVELLISDMDGDEALIDQVLDADPTILAHNVETVPRLHRKVRPRFRYERSIQVLAYAKERRPDVYTKSNIMVGLGETPAEVMGVMRDLRQAGCDFLTIGQYLRPSPKHLPVAEYVTPEMFARYREEAYALGFAYVASGPLVRSSFEAGEALEAIRAAGADKAV